MTRWITTFFYALMFACAALPVQGAASVGASVLTTVAVAAVGAESQDVGEHGAPTSKASSDPSGLGSTPNDSNTPEVPELFFEAFTRLALPVHTAEVPPSIAVPMSPHPFLKGLQRPPRKLA